MPLKHLKINSDYGYRIHPLTGRYAMHYGVDLRARADTVYAVMEGLVVHSGYDRYLGFNVRVKHNGELYSIYGHMSRLWVTTGDSLKCGQAIGITGATGRVTGEHLHFSICYRKRYLNPIEFLYKQLINKQNEQNQITSGTAVRKADR